MRTVRHIALWLACLALTPFLITYAYGQSVGTYVQSSTGNILNAQGVTGVPRAAGSPTACGGTITTGGTSQQASTSFSQRTYVYVQNPISATEPLSITFGGVAPLPGAGNAFELAPGGTFSMNGNDGTLFTGSIFVNAATTGHRFICYIL